MEVFPCPICLEDFSTEGDMASHAVNDHKVISGEIKKVSIKGKDLLIAKTSEAVNGWSCPSCGASGTLGVVCVHYIGVHDPLSIYSSSNAVIYGPKKPILDVKSIITAHPTPATFFAFVGSKLNECVDACPVELVMLGIYDTSHSLLCQCSTSHSLGCVDRFEKWKRIIDFNYLCGCPVCLCPDHTSFGQHPHKAPCPPDTREDWKSWMLGIPFLVYNTRALREPIFGALGIAENALPDPDDYADWVVDGVVLGAEQATNALLIIYVFLLLQSNGDLMVPMGGYEFDDA